MNGLDSLFVPYEDSMQLKKLGFNEPCCSYFYKGEVYFDNEEGTALVYNDDEKSDIVVRPTWEQAFAWLCKKTKLEFWIQLLNDGSRYRWHVKRAYDYITQNKNERVGVNSSRMDSLFEANKGAMKAIFRYIDEGDFYL